MRVSMFRVAMLAAFAVTSQADFSYVTTVKSGGPSAGTVTKHKIKGNKMRIDTGTVTILTDMDAQTITTINHTAKTYTVSPVTQAGAAIQKSGVEMKADVKETGQQKKIGAFNCRQVMMTMTMTGQPMNMTMENEMWVSPDVPGSAELKTISTRMAERGVFPGGGDPQTKKMMADLQKQMAKVNGMPILQITRMKSGDDAQSKQMQAQMAAMRTQMEAMKKAGGKQAEMAEKALASMPAPGAKYMMEITSESGGFSAAAIPATEFALPAGYKKADR
jgi:hypothetical protein